MKTKVHPKSMTIVKQRPQLGKERGNVVEAKESFHFVPGFDYRGIAIIFRHHLHPSFSLAACSLPAIVCGC